MKYKDQFIIDFEEHTSFGFSALALNYFVEKVLKKSKDSKSSQLYFRLFRAGLLGDVLFKNGGKFIKSNKHTAECELLAAFFESYLFLIRTIYDYLLHFLDIKYGVKESSFYKFIKKIEKENYPEIKDKLRYYIQNKSFDEIRTLRDSIKRQTPHIFVYVKNNKYWVSGTMYKRDNKNKEYFDEKLRLVILKYSANLFLLMSYIAESMTGVSLKEQVKFQEKKSKK